MLLVGAVVLIGACTISYLYEHNPTFRYCTNNLLSYIIEPVQPPGEDTLSVVRKDKKKPNLHSGTTKKIKPDQFASLDNYARNTPEKYETDIPDLATYLTISAKDDLQKARLLYTWIASHIKYDDDAYNNNSNVDCSATGVLKNRKAICEGYCTLFRELGAAMGLQVQKITGYDKGYNYTVGTHFKETGHAWNLVKLSGQWRPFDVTWGAGYGDTRNKKLVTTTRFEPYWFNVNPKEFIFTHLPEDDQWQLTSTNITLAQFETLPRLDEEFFKLGFNPDEVFKEAVSGKTKDFVETYSPDLPLKAIRMPYANNLKKGEPVTVVISSDYAEQIAVVNKPVWVYFAKKDNQFSITYTPLDTTLEIAVKTNSYDKTFSTLAVYHVIQN